MNIDALIAAQGGRFDAAEVEVIERVLRGLTGPCRISRAASGAGGAQLASRHGVLGDH